MLNRSRTILKWKKSDLHMKEDHSQFTTSKIKQGEEN